MDTYIIILNNSSLFKIGKTKDLKSRIRQIKTANPFLKEVIYTQGDYENYLHRCLNNFRVKGEWFNLYNADIKKTVNYLIDIRKNATDDCEAVMKFLEELQWN